MTRKYDMPILRMSSAWRATLLSLSLMLIAGSILSHQACSASDPEQSASAPELRLAIRPVVLSEQPLAASNEQAVAAQSEQVPTGPTLRLKITPVAPPSPPIATASPRIVVSETKSVALVPSSRVMARTVAMQEQSSDPVSNSPIAAAPQATSPAPAPRAAVQPVSPPEQPLVPIAGYPQGDMSGAPPPHIEVCPALDPCRCGVYCNDPNGRCRELGWSSRRMIPWQIFAKGEYIGPARAPHVREYRLRVDDRVEFVYRLTAKQSSRPYRLEVGDRILIRSMSTDVLNQEEDIQPDGAITLQFLGQVPAAGRTLDELRTATE